MTDPTEIFDLDSLAAADTAELAIVHPITKAPTTWIWTFAGPGHRQTIALNEELGQMDRAESFAERRAIQSGRDPKARKTADVIEVNVRRYSGRVLGFTPARMGGEDLVFSPREAHRILKDPNFGWLFAQVFNFLRDDEAFIKGSSAS